MRVRLTLILLALTLLAGCGSSPGRAKESAASTTAGIVLVGGIAANPTCESVLADAFFQGEGAFAVSTSSAGRVSCGFQFRSGSSVLPKLGLRSKCPPQASIIVTFDLDPSTRHWRYDRQATAGVDNGGCLQ